MKAAGTVQMAIDAWLLDQFCQGHFPCLRFYTWERPTLSLGYHQRRWPQSWAEIPDLDIVRRPTGGRAVLHQGDLTYALVMEQPRGRRSQVYRDICRFLIEGLAALDMPVDFGGDGRYRDNPNCFGTSTAADLVDLNKGSKRVGSAQVWRDGGLLQHGSILLRPDSALFQQIFQQSVPELSLPKGLANLPDEMLHDRLIQALTVAAAAHFGAQFEVHPLSDREREQALAAWNLPVE
ncbi:hypothetical protein C7271_16240 [filamentous cyanobacterium CCP5]|nr:hypothetical protein C7271_16240 [filamentous cyanobacterium CCP5]